MQAAAKFGLGCSQPIVRQASRNRGMILTNEINHHRCGWIGQAVIQFPVSGQTVVKFLLQVRVQDVGRHAEIPLQRHRPESRVGQLDSESICGLRIQWR